MNPAEQEALFLQVRKRFPDAPVLWASGYVHGVVDEDGGQILPPREYRERASEDYDSYAVGYTDGFLDARGDDCLQAPWARECVDSGHPYAFRWWWKGRR